MLSFQLAFVGMPHESVRSRSPCLSLSLPPVLSTISACWQQLLPCLLFLFRIRFQFKSERGRVSVVAAVARYAYALVLFVRFVIAKISKQRSKQ